MASATFQFVERNVRSEFVTPPAIRRGYRCRYLDAVETPYHLRVP